MRSRFSLLCGLMLTACTAAMGVQPELGVNCPKLHGYRFFAPNHAWNRDISADPVDAGWATVLAFYGSSTYIHCDFGVGSGIPYNVVSGSQRKLKLLLDSPPEEGDGLMFPIPPTAAIEGGGDGGNGDSHCLVLDRDSNIIYETFTTRRVGGGKNFAAAFGCVFDMNTSVLRPMPWSSADAAGLSVLAGLCRGDEVIDDGVINHPIRLVISSSKMSFVQPATHHASPFTGPNYLPMGARLRLKASCDISYYPTQAHVIAAALQNYGMILADNGGNFYLSGSPDSRWNSYHLQFLGGLCLADFELVQRGEEYRF